jgi:hypothetical protein
VSVTLRYKGEKKTVGADRRVAIPSGAQVEILEATFAEGVKANNLHLTLGGQAVASPLPQTCMMRDIALNLRVFNGNALAGKITLVP